MNNNDELINKCLDTLEPKWLSAVIGVITEDGVEFELFSKTCDVHEQVVLLSTVSAGSVVELERLIDGAN
jgi:hypothetical protein